MACERTYTVLVVLAVLGAVLLIIGGSLVPVFNEKITQDVRRFVLPVNGSRALETWQNCTRFQPVYRYFYFFKVLNPDKIVKTGKNTTVKETGPYVYRVHFMRRDAAFTANGTRLSYKLYKKYTFERNMSVGSEDDLVMTVNLPILNLATRLKYANSTITTKLKTEVKRLNVSLFRRVRVKDVLWGYKDQDLDLLLKFLDDYFGIHPLKDPTYGLLYQSKQPIRTTFEGSFETSTGADDIKTLWNLRKWNGNSSLSVWQKNTSCNDINGPDGYSWRPLLSKGQPLFIFDTDWCRSIRMNATDSEGSDGRMPTFQYFFHKDAFSYKFENRGFCKPLEGRHQQCHQGVLNASECKDNIPLVLSQPHFLGASKIVRETIRGLTPNFKQHSTTFNLEPLTGEVVMARRKIQLNAFVMHFPMFPDTTKLGKSSLVIPVVWMNEVYTMADEERDSLMRNVRNRFTMYNAIQFSLIAVGSCLLLCTMVAILVVLRRSRRRMDGERQPLLQ